MDGVDVEAMDMLADRVLVRPVEIEHASPAGIVIAQAGKVKPRFGEVIMVGPGRLDDDGKTIPLEVAAGDRVMFSEQTGVEVQASGEPLLVMTEADIMGVVQ